MSDANTQAIAAERRKQERARDTLRNAARYIAGGETAAARQLLYQASVHLDGIPGGCTGALPDAPEDPAPEWELSGDGGLLYQRAQKRAGEAASDAADLAALGRIDEARDTLAEAQRNVDTMEQRKADR